MNLRADAHIMKALWKHIKSEKMFSLQKYPRYSKINMYIASYM